MEEYDFKFNADLSFFKSRQSASIGFLYSLRDALLYFDRKREKDKQQLTQAYLWVNQTNDWSSINKDELNILINRCISSIKYWFSEEYPSNDTVGNVLAFRDSFSRIKRAFTNIGKSKIVVHVSEFNRDIVFDALKDFPLNFDKSLTVSIKVLKSEYNIIEIEDE